MRILGSLQQKFLPILKVYLIHSLHRKDFKDFDPKIARSAVVAAKAAGVKKIIYLGGIIPKGEELSAHLASREETGRALAGCGLPVFEVRASIILGRCSVSYQIAYCLAKKHPLIVGPRSLNSYCAPIALDDVAEMLEALIMRFAIKRHEIFEIGSENIRYRDLIALCGEAVRGRKNRIIPVPYCPIFIFARYIQLISGVNRRVAASLIQSMKDDTVPGVNRFSEVTGRAPRRLDATLKELAKEMESIQKTNGSGGS